VADSTEQSSRFHPQSWVPAICLVLSLAAVAIVYFTDLGATPLQRLALIVGYVIIILIFCIGLLVLIAMSMNKIDLGGLLCEPGANKASMARLQLLIFTFVIGFSLCLIIVSAKDGPAFPTIPSGILMLLGISASTYAVGKGLQASHDQQQDAEGQAATQAAAQAAGREAGHAAGLAAGQVAGQVAGQAAGHAAGAAAAQAAVQPPKG
jgi:hypothetical protein